MSKAPRRIRIVVAVVVFIIMALGFAGKLPLLPQLGPAILRLIATGALTAAAWVFGFVALTFLFGRFYCAVMCPLGMLQDFIGWLSRRKGATRKNLQMLRYTLLVAMTGLLAAGWVIGAKLLEPFSLFGRFFAGLALPVLAKTGRKHGLWIIDGDYGSTSAGLAAGLTSAGLAAAGFATTAGGFADTGALRNGLGGLAGRSAGFACGAGCSRIR